MTHEKALVIKQPIANLALGLFATAIVSGVTFAVTVYADTNQLKSQMGEIRSATLPERMARIEQKVESGFQNMQSGQMQQQTALLRIEEKLEDIQKHPRNERAR